MAALVAYGSRVWGVSVGQFCSLRCAVGVRLCMLRMYRWEKFREVGERARGAKLCVCMLSFLKRCVLVNDFRSPTGVQ